VFQPTLSRLENAPRLRDVIRLTYTLVDAWMDSYPCEPASVTLDIDDTCDVVHGHQQLSLFNAHYDERCFLPIHVYDTEKSRPVAVVLRPGKTPGGVEVRAHLRRLVRHIRTRWHKTRITFRGDGHYARPEAMTWCENNGIDYIFGLSGTKPLARKVDEVADDIRTRRAIENLPVLRAIPRPATRQSPGIANGVPSPVLRRRCSASTSASSSPASMSARPSGSTTVCMRARPSRESDQAA